MKVMSTLQKSALLAAAALAFACAAHAASSGEKVYEKTCTVCHSDGLSGAPRLGNKPEWAPRIPKGKDALVESVRNGKGLMPPRGGNDRFTDEDLRAAVEFIVSKAQ